MFFFNIVKFIRHSLGNFAILTAILIPILLMFIGFIIDIANIFFTKSKLNDSVERSLIQISAHILSSDDFPHRSKVTEIAKRELSEELQYSFREDVDDIVNNSIISIDSNNDSNHYTISISADYKLPYNIISRVLYLYKDTEYITISTKNSILSQKEVKGSLSKNILFILDTSGSMLRRLDESKSDGIVKMDAMKSAVNLLVNKLETRPNHHDKIKLGAVSFAAEVDKTFDISSGTKSFMKKVYDLDLAKKGYSTNSHYAMAKGYKMLSDIMKSKETSKNYIVFVTDGANSSKDSNNNTISTCIAAKRDGIEIFAIAIAFDSYAKHIASDLLIQCVSSNDNLYFINDVDAMNEAFIKIGEAISQNKASRIF
ncbi:MAG: hypothetical protein C4617_05530 [Candidatus Liberibacter europaeus]|uniref:VWFA domain-containing protein n=1 Tax=Candidatus Liberibacter europaeus TaxID=744859 RepID=A0A2T4VWC3_9HYPH|nr:hypothetical protein [Candidatus Liberibacter europaeus]PTL86084.1 MAG: hypothetical protein C4617_05530 [Candidatus Liberibacter europaeus]